MTMNNDINDYLNLVDERGAVQNTLRSAQEAMNDIDKKMASFHGDVENKVAELLPGANIQISDRTAYITITVTNLVEAIGRMS